MNPVFKLPFEIPTPKCDAVSAFPYGAIKGHFGSAFYGWLFGKMVNCSFTPHSTDNKYNISLTGNWAEGSGVTYRQLINLSKDVLLSTFHDLSAMLQKILCANTYITLSFPTHSQIVSPCSQARLTDLLIYGYNAIEMLFYVASIDNQYRLEMYEIGQAHLTSIILNFPTQTIPLELRTFTDNYQIKPSLGWMQKELSDYLLSQNTIPHLDNKNIYGLAAQEALSQYILQTTNTYITSDLLYMYRFIEHKTLMAERVHGLYKMEVCPEEIYNLSEHISLLANELVLPSFGDELSVAHATNFASTVHAITTIELSCYPLLLDYISKALPLRNQ